MPANKKSLKFQNITVNKIIITAIFLFLFFFTLYFSLGLLLSHTRAFNISGVLFETDIPRGIGDMTSFSADHYRTKVHPLFVLLVNPLGLLLMGFIKSHLIAAAMLNSLLGAVGVLLVFIYFHMLTQNLVDACLLAGFFGVTASQFFLSSIPETATLAVCSLLATYILFLADMKGHQHSLPFWIAAGIFTLAVTTTNFIQTSICFLIVSFIRSPQKNRLLHIGTKLVVFLASVIIITMALALLQKGIYPSSRLFYTPEFYEEETLYTSFLVLQAPLTVISQLARHFFLVNIIAPFPATFPFEENNLAVTFSRALNFSALGWFAVILWLFLFFWSLIQILQKKQLLPLTLSFVFTLCLIFNLALHSIYGIGAGGGFEYFLYTGNFTFLAINFISHLPYFSKTGLRYLLALLILSTGINNLIILTKIINIYI